MSLKSLTRAGVTGIFVWITLLTPATAYANCYTVYKGDVRVYHAQIPPVDASLPYSETVPARFGAGAMMVVMPGAFDCPSENELRGGDALAGDSGSKEADAVAHANALSRLAERHGERSDNDNADGSGTNSYGGGTFTRGPLRTGPRGGRYYVNSNGNKSYVSGGGRRR